MVKLVHVPGVHRPLSDTWLLREAMAGEPLRGAAVADLCCGSGVLAIAAARAGAARVLAVDISLRSTLATRLNARLNGCAVRARRGDLIGAIADERFDLIVSNPPYVPASSDALPRHRSTTPLDGGHDGRALIDRLCREAPARLRRGGALLIVHSSVCGIDRTRRALEREGLRVEVLARRRGKLGPVLRSRAAMLRERGLLGERDEEELAVVRGRRPQEGS
jgi:release factor glutamine methyltransferase